MRRVFDPPSCDIEFAKCRRRRQEPRDPSLDAFGEAVVRGDPDAVCRTLLALPHQDRDDALALALHSACPAASSSLSLFETRRVAAR